MAQVLCYPSDFKVSTAEGREEILAWVAEISGTPAHGGGGDQRDEGDVRKRKMDASSEDELLSSIKKTPEATFMPPR